MPTQLTIIPTIGIVSDATGPANPPAGYYVPYIGPDGALRIRTHQGIDLTVPLTEGNAVLPLPTANGKILTSLDGAALWSDPPTIPGAELPSGGTAGQILTRTSTGLAWADAPSGGGGGSAARNAAYAVYKGYYRTPTGSGVWYPVPGMSVTLTPSTAAKQVLLRLALDLGSSPADRVIFSRITRNGAVVNPPAAAGARQLLNGSLSYNHGNPEVSRGVAHMTVDSPASAAAQTYAVEVMIDGRGGYVSVNGSGADTDTAVYGYRATSCLFAEEL